MFKIGKILCFWIISINPTSVGCQPNSSGLILLNGSDGVVAQALRIGRIKDKLGDPIGVPVELGYSFLCSDPKIFFAVLEK